MAKLDGKVALITGAAAGLGEGIASAYAKYGAKMILVDLSPAVEETAEKPVSYTHLDVYKRQGEDRSIGK